MRIQTNIMALNTHRQLGINNLNQTKSTEKLSSGFRVNRAADDASGLSISEKMRAQIRGLNQASSNAQDGISLIQAAEGALQESHSILQRMRELAVKAANDINESEDRDAIQAELNQLTKEIDRIAYTTEFNKKTLLDGSLQNGGYATKLLAGTAVGAGVHINAAMAASAVANGKSVEDIYTISVATAGSYSQTTYSYDLTGLKAGDTFSVQLNFNNRASAATGIAGGQFASIAMSFTYTATGDGKVDNAAFINGLKDTLSQIVTDYNISTEGTSITFTAKGIGTSYGTVSLVGSAQTSTGATITNGTGVASTDRTITSTGKVVNDIVGVDTVVKISANVSGATSIVTTQAASGAYINGTFTDKSSGLVFQLQDPTKLGTSVVQVKAGKDLALQVGANSGADQAIKIGVQSLSASGLGIDNIRVDTHIAAQATVSAIEKAIQTVSAQRSDLGAVQNRLEHTVANLDTVAENITSAESRIRDVDMAKEMMNFTKNNILSQAATAMLAQANQAPQTVLQLLR